jgi:hypothetical protein
MDFRSREHRRLTWSRRCKRAALRPPKSKLSEISSYDDEVNRDYRCIEGHRPRYGTRPGPTGLECHQATFDHDRLQHAQFIPLQCWISINFPHKGGAASSNQIPLHAADTGRVPLLFRFPCRSGSQVGVVVNERASSDVKDLAFIRNDDHHLRGHMSRRLGMCRTQSGAC